jgi:branched-chain amino acid transport system ATP-binding protein
MEDNVMLRVEDVDLSFGGVRALIGVSMEVRRDEILAVIGPNGAGKTCLLNSISGFYHPQKGSIYFLGQEISKVPSHKRAEMGLGRTFQNIELYTGLSVAENCMAGRQTVMKSGWLSNMLYFGWTHREEVKHRERVEEIIDFLEMEEVRNHVVGALPYGQRKRTELGRALALEPKLLLLDEPMAGMNMEEKEDIARFIIDIFEDWGTPVVLVEHDMGVVMDIADRLIVLDFGRKIAEGTPEEIKTNPEVVKAYLGTEETTYRREAFATEE